MPNLAGNYNIKGVDMTDLFTGKKSPELLEYLHKRRSALAKKGLVGDAPSAQELEQILTAAARVPDHGKTCPFYFLVFQGDARHQAGQIVADVFARENPDASADKLREERERFLRAPMVIGVVYRARQGKHPLWEQMMCAGAACQNLLLAANALGYGAQWLSEWYAYHDDVRSSFGLDGRDVVAGFMYIGQPSVEAEERERPDLSQILTHWTPDAALNKGDGYNRDKFDLPKIGFDIKE